MEYYQESKFACSENDEVLQHLSAALSGLINCDSKRREQGVEGKHEKHV